MEKKKLKKILNIHDYPPIEGGGIEVTTFETSKALSYLGYESTIATSRLASETVGKKSSAGRSEKIKTILLTKVSQLEKLILSTDIVQINFTFSFRPACMLALKICAEKNIPCVFSFQTVYDHIPFSATFTDTQLERDRKFCELKKYLAQPNVYISGPSENVNETLKKLGINKKVKVIRNGCTTIKINVEPNLAIKKVNLTYVGELSFLKGINYLIDALNLLKKRGQIYTARLIGGGSDELELKRLVSYNGLDKQIEFTGYVNNQNVPFYLAKTDVYVHPSLTESWGNAVVEALALGIPVLCTNVGGLVEATNNGKFAVLVEPGDAYDLANKISGLFGEAGLTDATEKAKDAMDFIKNTYTFENQAKQLIEFYQNVLGNSQKFSG